MRKSIILKASLCTENPTGTDVYDPGSEDAQHVENTGIERQGGLTPIYEQETTFNTAGVPSMIAKDGTLVQVDASNNVRLNDQVIGNVGPLAIAQRGVLKGYIDAAWTADATLLTIARVGTSIFVYEIDPATGNVLHSRSTVFAGMPTGVTIINICLVKYVDMHYVDNQEFIVQTGNGVGTFAAKVLREVGASTTAIVGIATNYASVFFCWRFAASKYIYGQANNSAASSWYIGDLTASTTNVNTTLPGSTPTFVSIDRFPGTAFSRAIITFPPAKSAANLFTGYAEVGYTSAGVYSATPVAYGIALAAVTAVTSNAIVGPGYVECTFTRSDTGTNVYYYQAAPYANNIAQYYTSTQSNNPIPINGYSKLTNIFNTTTGANVANLVSWRIVFANGVQDFISAAPIGVIWDCIGVPITNVGEFDDAFLPIVTDDGSTFSRIVYRFGGNLYFVSITPTATHTLQKVSDNLYLVNCLSALNGVSIPNKMLVTGTTDYNGRLIVNSTSAAGAVTKTVSLIQGGYSNSTDTGEKLFVQTPTFANMGTLLLCPGVDPPSFWDRRNDFAINLYVGAISDTYIGSFVAYSTIVLLSDFSGILYIPDTRLPFGMGYTFQDRTMQTEIETIFTGVGVTGSADIDFDYMAYELGNDTPALYQSFVLFGQTYLFDGKNIWMASFNGALFEGRGSSPICPATGMVYIASSPVAIYFYSLFDNSLYIFNGGRTLEKIHLFNDVRNSSNVLENFINGVYNVRDGTLLIQTATTIIWIRDSYISQNYKKANQIASFVSLYDTVNGIQIANNTIKWVYSFFALSNSTIVPFVFKSAYFGVGAGILMANSLFDLAIYSPDKSQAQIFITCDEIDADGSPPTQTQPITIMPVDWSSNGLYKCRIRPQAETVIAASVGLQTTSKLVLHEVDMEWTEVAPAVPANARSV